MTPCDNTHHATVCFHMQEDAVKLIIISSIYLSVYLSMYTFVYRDPAEVYHMTCVRLEDNFNVRLPAGF